MAASGKTSSAATCLIFEILFLLRRKLHRLVAATRLEIRHQRDVTRQHENREQRHFAERAELAGGRGVGDCGRRSCVGNRRAFHRINRLIFAEQIIFLHGHGLIQRRIRGGQLFGRRRFLQIADERCAENSHGEHSDSAHRVQGERAAARTLFGSQTENGRPEKSFADAVKCRGGEDGEHSTSRAVRAATVCE